jgi:hypothetical protein
MQVSDDLYLGTAPILMNNPANPTYQDLGVGPMGRVFVWDVVPVTLQTAGIAAVQLLAAAGDMTLTAGTGTTSVTLPNGYVGVQLDTPRCVTLTVATTNQSALTFTIYGYDQYGQHMTFAIAGPNNNTVATTKAFKTIYRVTVSGQIATNGVSVGFNDKLGLPFRVTDVCYVQSVKWATTLAQDAGTFVAADTTSPATATTTDVRGCYTPSSAANGTRRLVMTIALPALASGSNATRIGAAGVDQA